MYFFDGISSGTTAFIKQARTCPKNYLLFSIMYYLPILSIPTSLKGNMGRAPDTFSIKINPKRKKADTPTGADLSKFYIHLLLADKKNPLNHYTNHTY